MASNSQSAAAAAAAAAAQQQILKDNERLMGALSVRGQQVQGTTSFAPLPAGSSGKGGRKTRRRFKKKRLMSRKYCKKTPCRRMGFTQKASCRPYKNCYK